SRGRDHADLELLGGPDDARAVDEEHHRQHADTQAYRLDHDPWIHRLEEGRERPQDQPFEGSVDGCREGRSPGAKMVTRATRKPPSRPASSKSTTPNVGNMAGFMTTARGLCGYRKPGKDSRQAETAKGFRHFLSPLGSPCQRCDRSAPPL